MLESQVGKTVRKVLSRDLGSADRYQNNQANSDVDDGISSDEEAGYQLTAAKKKRTRDSSSYKTSPRKIMRMDEKLLAKNIAKEMKKSRGGNKRRKKRVAFDSKASSDSMRKAKMLKQ